MKIKITEYIRTLHGAAQVMRLKGFNATAKALEKMLLIELNSK